jgi:hypothetical protein
MMDSVGNGCGRVAWVGGYWTVVDERRGVEHFQAMDDSIGLRSTSRLPIDMNIRMYWFTSVKSPLQASLVCISRLRPLL